jgi:hypothetical protein
MLDEVFAVGDSRFEKCGNEKNPRFGGILLSQDVIYRTSYLIRGVWDVPS